MECDCSGFYWFAKLSQAFEGDALFTVRILITSVIRDHSMKVDVMYQDS